MALDLPDTSTVVSSFEVANVITEDGDTAVSFGYEGMSIESVIGLLTVVLDRLREERRFEWDTCPECHEPWATHEGFEDDEDDEDEEDDE